MGVRVLGLEGGFRVGVWVGARVLGLVDGFGVGIIGGLNFMLFTKRLKF